MLNVLNSHSRDVFTAVMTNVRPKASCHWGPSCPWGTSHLTGVGVQPRQPARLPYSDAHAAPVLMAHICCHSPQRCSQSHQTPGGRRLPQGHLGKDREATLITGLELSRGQRLPPALPVPASLRLDREDDSSHGKESMLPGFQGRSALGTQPGRQARPELGPPWS